MTVIDRLLSVAVPITFAFDLYALVFRHPPLTSRMLFAASILLFVVYYYLRGLRTAVPQ